MPNFRAISLIGMSSDRCKRRISTRFSTVITLQGAYEGSVSFRRHGVSIHRRRQLHLIPVSRLLCDPKSINLIEHREAEGLPTEDTNHGFTGHVLLDVFRALARLEASTTFIGLPTAVRLEVRGPVVKMTGKRQSKK